ncbi:MAG: hypothetical protein FWG65_04415 [Turicibacter sp.]|nr:hypothetical protein [Turicibacter sp.]
MCDFASRLELLRNDKIVAEIHGETVVNYADDAPILIKKGRFNDWKTIRTQDLNRPNSRALRRMLGLSTSNAQDVLPSIYYQSISDAYWLRPHGDGRTWADIQFTDDRFFHITLTGKKLLDNPKIYESPNSPEHSNTGSFEKGWRYVPSLKTKWQLWKAGSPEAVWSEIFYSKLANEIFPDIAVDYWEEDGFSVCNSFIDREVGECLEPFYALADSHDDPHLALNVLPVEVHETYKKMLFLDALMFNWDRHEFNFGLIRDKDDKISLHPLYDHNLALFNAAAPTATRFEDTTIKMFKALSHPPYTITAHQIELAYNATTPKIAATLSQTTDFLEQSLQLLRD